MLGGYLRMLWTEGGDVIKIHWCESLIFLTILLISRYGFNLTLNPVFMMQQMIIYVKQGRPTILLPRNHSHIV